MHRHGGVDQAGIVSIRSAMVIVTETEMVTAMATVMVAVTVMVLVTAYFGGHLVYDLGVNIPLQK